jgi:hypothetical protein
MDSGGTGLQMLSRTGEMRLRLNWIARFTSRRTPIWIAFVAAAVLMLTGLTDPRTLRGGETPDPGSPSRDGPWQTSKVVRDYGVTALPSMFLIDPEGRIAGYNLWTRPLAEVLDKLAAKQQER